MSGSDDYSRQPMDMPRARVPRGTVHVIVERCKECSYCLVYCPQKVLEYSTDTNSKGYHYPVVAQDKTTACVYCKFCDLICPELAIYTTEADAPEGQ